MTNATATAIVDASLSTSRAILDYLFGWVRETDVPVAKAKRVACAAAGVCGSDVAAAWDAAMDLALEYQMFRTVKTWNFETGRMEDGLDFAADFARDRYYADIHGR